MKAFFHHSDLDGHCSGAIIRYAYNCKTIGINYGQPFPFDKIIQGEAVFLVDFSLSPDDMLKLDNLSTLFWIDHHKTAIDSLPAYFAGYREIGLGACELTWKYVFTKPVPIAVHLLGMYDVFDFSDSRTLAFQYGIRTYKNTYPDNQQLWSSLFENNVMLIEQIITKGTIILEYEQTQNEKFCKAFSFETAFEGYKAICCNKGFTNSKLFDTAQNYDIMITFCRRNKQWYVSLYTVSNTIDCGAIAKKYDGGGHQKAAGFSCTELPFEY